MSHIEELEAEIRYMKRWLNELADNDSSLWRVTRTRPISVSAFIQSEARKVLKGDL